MYRQMRPHEAPHGLGSGCGLVSWFVSPNESPWGSMQRLQASFPNIDLKHRFEAPFSNIVFETSFSNIVFKHRLQNSISNIVFKHRFQTPFSSIDFKHRLQTLFFKHRFSSIVFPSGCGLGRWAAKDLNLGPWDCENQHNPTKLGWHHTCSHRARGLGVVWDDGQPRT